MSSTRTQPGRRWVSVLKVAVPLVAVAVVVGVLSGVSRQPAAPSGGAGSLDIATATVMSFDVTTTATGELESARQIEIRNRLERPTTIVDIIAEGTHVQKGEVLIRLNSDDVQEQVDSDQLQVSTARADLAAAEAAYAIQESENDSNIRKARLTKDLAELDLRQWLEGVVASKRQDLALALDKARREHERLKDKFERSKSLESRGFLSKDELKRDELAFLEAEAAVKTATLNQRVYEEFEFPKDRRTKESAVEEGVAELDRAGRKAESELATKEAERINRRRQLELREQRLAKLREQVANATLRAPIDGLVVYATSMQRNRWGQSEGGLQIGQQVYQNQALILLPDTSEMVATVRVSESLAGRIRKGQTATVKVDALAGRSLRGEVESVGVLAEQGGWRDPNLREYSVKVKLVMEPGVAIRPSMRCEAEIQIERVEDALSVPVQAIFTEGLVRYVHVPSGAKFIRRPVSVGRRSDRFAEVKSGLSAGQRVLVRKPEGREVLAQAWTDMELQAVGLKRSPEGQIVSIAPPEPAEAAVPTIAPPERPGGGGNGNNGGGGGSGGGRRGNPGQRPGGGGGGGAGGSSGGGGGGPSGR